MKNILTHTGTKLLILGVLAVLTFSSCTKNECEDIVCAPCPSSRLMVQYVDTLGGCEADFHSRASITAYSGAGFVTEEFSYNLSDSCTAGFLIQEDLSYILVSDSGWVNDTFVVLQFEYQPAQGITECCFCYPLSSVTFLLNGDTTVVSYPDGEYENVPLSRDIY